MTNEEFDDLIHQVRQEISRKRLAPEPAAGPEDDRYAVAARHTEFGACAH